VQSIDLTIVSDNKHQDKEIEGSSRIIPHWIPDLAVDLRNLQPEELGTEVLWVAETAEMGLSGGEPRVEDDESEWTGSNRLRIASNSPTAHGIER
jgi:hypothetical protein